MAITSPTNHPSTNSIQTSPPDSARVPWRLELGGWPLTAIVISYIAVIGACIAMVVTR
jgi:hypothetical protein